MDTLTGREIEVLRVLADVYTSAAVAAHLGITEATVINHLMSIRKKLGVQRTLGAVVICLKRGLLGVELPSACNLGTGVKAFPTNCTGFCKVCEHGVYNMESHLLTEEHRRNARREGISEETRTV